MSTSNFVLYEVYGNARAVPERIEVNWINRPSFILLNECYVYFIDVYIPSEEYLPVSNFCPRLLVPNLLHLSVTRSNRQPNTLDYSEEILLRETSRLGRFAFSFTPTTVGRFTFTLSYQQAAVWSSQVHVLDSWMASEKGEISGPLVHAKVVGSFFGQRVLDNRSVFIISVAEPCYVGVADTENRTKTWSTLVNPGITKLEIVDKQLHLITMTNLGVRSQETTEEKTIRIDLRTFYPYVKLKQGQEAQFTNVE